MGIISPIHKDIFIYIIIVIIIKILLLRYTILNNSCSNYYNINIFIIINKTILFYKTINCNFFNKYISIITMAFNNID